MVYCRLTKTAVVNPGATTVPVLRSNFDAFTTLLLENCCSGCSRKPILQAKLCCEVLVLKMMSMCLYKP